MRWNNRRGVVLASFLICVRLIFIQLLWNYNKMMGYGFCFVLLPVVKKYGVRDVDKFVRRYDKYFNTHPFMAAFIAGAAAGLEKRYAVTGNESLVTEIENIKLKMMGPLAALGDSFFWGSLKPFIILSAAVALFVSQDYMDPFMILLFYLLLYNIIHIFIIITGFRKGYKDMNSVLLHLKALNLQKKVDLVRRTAIILLGASWGFGMVTLLFADIKLALPLLAASLLIIYTVRKIPNILIFYVILILLLIGGIIW